MILILGGTSDTHDYAVGDYVISVATDYGFKLFLERYPNKVIQTRFTLDSLKQFISDKAITEIIDTTHPFAKEISAIAQTVCQQCSIPYTFRKRKTELDNKYLNYEKLIIASNWEDAARKIPSGRVFFTIGSKNLHYFNLQNAIVRVLDDPASIAVCKALGLNEDAIIAARGPFSTEDNLQIIHQHAISCLVTKESGSRGGIKEKFEAAMAENIHVLLIRNS